MVITQEITLDIARENAYKTIIAKQNDEDSRFLKITIACRGEVVDVPTSGHMVVINARRSDKKEDSFYGSVNDDGTITVPLPNWVLEVEGTAKCNVSIVSGDGAKLSSLDFTVLVEQSNSNTSIKEDDKYDVLTALITAEIARQEAEQARNNAEIARNEAFTEKMEESDAAIQNANDAAQQAASAVLAGGFLPIYNEDTQKNYTWQIVIRDGYPVLTMTEITE